MPRIKMPGAMPEHRNARGYLKYVLPAAALFCPAAAQSQTVSFEADVQPILTQHCVMCHIPGAAQGGHSLYPDAWESMVDVPSVQSALLLVEPGRPTASYSYLKLTGGHLAAGGKGEVMPSPQTPLAQGEIDIIREWIKQGAEKN